MRHLRRSAIFLLIGLVIFFNIERLDVGEENIIDIQSFVYVLGALAVISIIAVPILWRSRLFVPITVWLGVYLVGKFFFFEDRPLLGGIYTYLSITEMTFLSILIWLTHDVARAFCDFEEAVENITLTDLSHRVRSLSEVNEDIQIELTRSRRHQRPLSVVVVEPEPDSIQVALHRTVQEVQQAMMTRYVITSLARVFNKVLRRIDVVIEQREQGRFVILCPETNAAGSNVLADRIQAAVAEQLGVSVKCGTASFPDEALTFEELVRQAESHLQQPAELPERANPTPTEVKGMP